MINKQTIDKIFETARIEEVVGDFVTLKKRGANMLGLCPFHNERTPSFNVSPVRGIYKCFGCGKAGNSVNFIMDHEQMNYPEALRYLAKKYSIEIEETEITDEEKKKLAQEQGEKESLMVVSSFAQKHFTDNLFNTDEGKSIGLSYFIEERGFRRDVVEKFQLGYAMENRRYFTNAAIEAGYKEEYMVKTGLTVQREGELPERAFDRFAGRVIFPIHNITGRAIGFGGRVMKKDAKTAKYLNSPESEIYFKSKILYGLYFAKKAIVENDNCFLVEGYTDVISMHQSGIENVVSSSGTSLTVDQIKLIRRYTQNITILYDGDNAGIKASFRGIDMILEEGLNVRVLLFPDGDDPDSFAKKHSEEKLKNYIDKNKQDFIAFKTSLLYSEAKNDPIKRAELIKDIVASIALIPEQITRSVYVQECSRIMAMEEQVLLNELNKLRRRKLDDKRKQQESETATTDLSETTLAENEKLKPADDNYQERDIVRLMLQYTDKNLLFLEKDTDGFETEIQKPLPEFILHDLINDGVGIETEAYNKIFAEYHRHYIAEQKKEPLPNAYFLNNENDEIKTTAINLLSSPYTLANWAKHNIQVTAEETILKHSVQSALYTLKLKYIEQLIFTKQNNLTTTQGEEDEYILLNEQRNLLEVKKAFSIELGRVVLK
jgi:DNA primase